MTYAKRVDANQVEIVQALRAVGASVQVLSAVGCGCPDLLCGYKTENYLLEVKTEDGKLTEDQIKWKRNWRGRVCVVRSTEEAFAAIGIGELT
jgi:hypothetical protein